MKWIILGKTSLDGVEADVDVTVQGVTFQSRCGSVFQSHDDYIDLGIDEDLLELVYQCLAVDIGTRPQLHDLAAAVQNQVLNRDPGDSEWESDQHITQLVKDLVAGPPDDPMDVDDDGSNSGG